MATNEPVEDQTYDAGDESYTIKQETIESDKAIEDKNELRQELDDRDESGENGDQTNERQDEHDHDGDDEDDDLEEGELKDDDDDDDDDDDALANNAPSNSRFSIFNNNTNNNDNNNNNNSNSNTSALNKDIYSSDQRLHNDPNHHNNSSNYSASVEARGPNQRPYHRQQNNRRHFSPNNQNHPGMHQHNFPPNQNHFPIINNNLYGFQPPHDGGGGPPPPVMLPQMNHHPVAGPMPGEMYPGGAPGNMGPMQKVNVRCRFYSKTNNKCTWGDDCRFEHRDDSPESNDVFDDRLVGPDGGPMRGPPQGGPPMGVHDRVYPPYRHQPYPPAMPPHAYGYAPYEHQPYGAHHSNSPPLPAHPIQPPHWRQQHSPYPPPVSNHPPESISPSMLSNSGSAQALPGPGPGGRLPSSQPMSGTPLPAAPTSAGATSPGYSSPSSSSAVYERKHRLAYEVAPWNDRSYPPSRYDRGDPAAGYHPASARGGYYRGQYGRDPYGREPPPQMIGPYPYQYGYPPNHPSAYRGGPPMGLHASHYRYSSSSQRNMPPDARHSRSNKRTRDGDSSWSDTGSDDSILGEASGSRGHSNKISKKDDYARTTNQTANETAISKSATGEHTNQGGSGTPPGEPLPEDRERQEMLLNKLKEIEDLMAKKKEKQEESL